MCAGCNKAGALVLEDSSSDEGTVFRGLPSFFSGLMTMVRVLNALRKTLTKKLSSNNRYPKYNSTARPRDHGEVAAETKLLLPEQFALGIVNL